jgi:glycerol-3-phosphate dehydrogenase
LVTQALQEMRVMARSFQMNQEVMQSVAGIGDLIATGFSEASSNHRVGLGLAEEGIVTLQSEGLASFAALTDLIGEETVKELPLFMTLKETLAHPEQKASLFKDLLEYKI